MKFSSEPPTAALFFLWGIRDVEIEIFERDQKFRSRLEISSKIDEQILLIVGPSGCGGVLQVLASGRSGWEASVAPPESLDPNSLILI